MKHPNETVNWKIAGVGGYGLQAAASVFARAMVQRGYFVHTYAEYPSIIKGGHATSQVRASIRPLYSHAREVDVLVCLDEHSIEEHQNDVAKGGALVYDTNQVHKQLELRSDITVIPIAMTDIVVNSGGEKIYRNAVALGASLELIGLHPSSLTEIVRDQYGGHGGDIVQRNLDLIDAGRRAIAPYPEARREWHPDAKPDAKDIVVTGNQAIGLGALQGGVQFYAGYPMTPSSTILKFMASQGAKHGVLVRQEQDEIAVINMAVGASLTGARAMVGTAGGGFSLMVEGYGLASIIEVPLVIVVAQRPGPATGLPTWTEQGDLQFVLHASQGDFPRVVLAHGSVEECFQLTAQAFNLAAQFQMPVILLTDKYLGESQWTTKQFDTRHWKLELGEIEETPGADYERYAITKSGVSPRVLPGTPGATFVANSDEHDGHGITSELIDVRLAQMDKRWRKLDGIRRLVPKPAMWGPKKAKLTVVTWGSTTMAVREALTIFEEQGVAVNAIQLLTMSPFPAAAVKTLLENAERLVLVEGNQTGQLRALIREHTGIAIEKSILRYDGRPFDGPTLAKQLEKYV